jgi:uncharacterized protein YndB with AHSA1/START domain
MTAAAQHAGTSPAGKMVEITRVFEAPRSLVFRAWTDQAHLVRWYAPNGCSTPFCAIDPRPGGVLHFCIRTADGTECWCKGTFREFVAPERLAYTLAFSDRAGNLLDSSSLPNHEDWPRETVVTVTFEEHEGGTRLTLRQTVLESLARKTGAYPSWLEMLDRLAALLARE